VEGAEEEKTAVDSTEGVEGSVSPVLPYVIQRQLDKDQKDDIKEKEALRKAEEEKAKVEREKWAKERLRPGVGDASLDETVFRRAEFWSAETATLREVLNVLGRFDSADEWGVRTKFLEVENIKEEDERQAATLKRYEMAQRMGMVERVALEFNAPDLPFRNEEIARAVGCTVEDFEGLKVTKAACGVVFDAL
jgi:hypothetical protein